MVRILHCFDWAKMSMKKVFGLFTSQAKAVTGKLVWDIFTWRKRRNYKKLLVENGSTLALDIITVQEEYDEALEGNTDLNRNLIKLGDLIELVYKDLFLAINTSSLVDKALFRLVFNAKSLEFPKSNSNVAWDELVNLYALHTASFVLKMKSELGG